jgi:UDP-glucose 4,6-dehydratase
VQKLFAVDPDRFQGFCELDEPNFCFKSVPCTFYSGTKALAEEAVRNQSQIYVWRFRLPFNEEDEPRNFLTQLRDNSSFRAAINSLSQVDECVAACLELWDRRVAFGTYNVVNPGAVCTQYIAQMIQSTLKVPRSLELLLYEEPPDSNDSREPVSDCILDPSKLLNTGVKLRDVHIALEHSLARWVSRPTSHLTTSR